MKEVDRWEEAGNRHVSPEPIRPMPARYKVIADLAIKHNHGGAVLDIGCGHGEMIHFIHAALPDVAIHVADAYPDLMDKIEAALNMPIGKTQLPEDSFQPSTLIAERFDCIIMSHILEHLPDPIGAVNDVLSLLNPDGVLILAVPNTSRPGVLILNMLGRHYVNRGHVYAWDRSHWRNFLERSANVEIIENAADTVELMPGGIGRFLARFTGRPLARLIPGWAVSCISVVQKPKSDA